LEEIKEQQLTLSDYLQILRRGKWIVIISFLLVVSSSIYFTFTAQPVYEASALIMLKEEGGVKSQIFEVTSYMQRETAINNHVEILKSRTLAEDVISRLEQSPYADSLWILGNRKKEKRFPVNKKLLSFFGKDTIKAEKPQFDDLVISFRKGGIDVVPRRDTDLIELKVQAYSPFEASFIANTWMEAYHDMDISESRGEVGEVRKFLEEKLKDVKEELTFSEENLKEYKEDRRVTELTAETDQLIRQSAEFEAMYQTARTELEANGKRITHLKAQLNESQKALVDEATSLSSPVIQQLQKQMAQLIAEKASFEQQLKSTDYYTKNDPKLKGMEQRLKGLQEKIFEETKKMVSGGAVMMDPLNFSETLLTQILELETENKSLKAKTDALYKIVRQYSRNLDALPEKSLKLARLQREREVNNNIFMMLREKYEENRIAEAGQIGSVRIIDRAKPPKHPIKPKKKVNIIISIIMGLGLGLGITSIREYLDTSLKSIEDVERMGFPVLGSIPFITPQRINKHINGRDNESLKIESRLITHFAPKSPISEAYRTLRTNIQYSIADYPIKTVLVTSSGPGEGKSTSVSNLAITFAQMGAKTLLIDTDLRRPVLHSIFGHSKNEGLTNVLVGRSSIEEAVKETKMENLHLLTSGTLPPNPSELLNSSAMERFLEESKSQFDILLFDTPPVIAVTDAAVLSTKIDGVVLVIRSGEADRDALIRSHTLLEKVKAKFLGVLVNGVNVNMMYGSYYYYYQQYYTSGDGKSKTHRKKHKSLV
jgi:tyrosine-protein kinase Etk/Wzc